MSSDYMTRMFPVCEIDAPRTDERVTVIYAAGGKRLSSATLESGAVVTEVVDVEIEPADKPHYIVLSSGNSIIWRFTGHIDTISRIVALGSQYNGPTHAGIVGVPKERVSFVKTDLAQLKKVQVHSCLQLHAACEPSAYFDIPKVTRMELAGPLPQERYRVDQLVEHTSAELIRIPGDETVMAGGRDRFASTITATRESGIVPIDVTAVISPEGVRPYKVLPGYVGLRDLIKSGAVVGPDAREFKTAYEAWNQTLSAPFRSHLDPDFLFSYKVDYLIARPVQLPAALPDMSFLVADGVGTPDSTGNWLACLFFADRRELVIDRRKQRDPRCDGPFAGGRTDRERSLALARWSLERAARLSEAEKAPCRQSLIDEGTYFAGIAISEGPAYRAGVRDPSRRRVDVFVKRPGKVALYLEIWGGRTDWHVVPSPTTQVSRVLLGAPPPLSGEGDKVHGIDASVSVSSTWVERWDAPCGKFNPSRSAYLGGPAALALDEGLKVLTGRGLDHLVRNENDGRWPPVSNAPDAPRVTLEIE
jgi:hypothetical protein